MNLELYRKGLGAHLSRDPERLQSWPGQWLQRGERVTGGTEIGEGDIKWNLVSGRVDVSPLSLSQYFRHAE